MNVWIRRLLFRNMYFWSRR